MKKLGLLVMVMLVQEWVSCLVEKLTFYFDRNVIFGTRIIRPDVILGTGVAHCDLGPRTCLGKVWDGGRRESVLLCVGDGGFFFLLFLFSLFVGVYRGCNLHCSVEPLTKFYILARSRFTQISCK